MNKNESKKINKFSIYQAQLSNREKNLIFILMIIIILIVGGKYIIIPTYQEMSELKIESEDIKERQSKVTQAIEDLESEKLETQKLMVQAEKSAENVSVFLNDEGVDNLITKLCIQNNLKPVALSIESDPYDKIDLEKMPGTPDIESDVLGEDSVDNESKEVKIEESRYIRSAEVSLVINGSKKSILGFIDNINNVSYLLVESFTSSFSNSNEDLSGEKTHNMKIKINMINATLK